MTDKRTRERDKKRVLEFIQQYGKCMYLAVRGKKCDDFKAMMTNEERVYSRRKMEKKKRKIAVERAFVKKRVGGGRAEKGK